MTKQSNGKIMLERTRSKSGRIAEILFGFVLILVAPIWSLAQSPCDWYPAGSTIGEPEDLYSQNGVLEVNFTYQTALDSYGIPLYCFVNSDGVKSPTLHVRPGDTLIINLTNLVPEGSGTMPAMPAMEMSKAGEGGCGAANMT